MLVGKIMAAAELSTSSRIRPSAMLAAAQSGRSVYRTLGKGLNHCRPIRHSARLSCAMVRVGISMLSSFFFSLSSSFLSTRFSI